MGGNADCITKIAKDYKKDIIPPTLRSRIKR